MGIGMTRSNKVMMKRVFKSFFEKTKMSFTFPTFHQGFNLILGRQNEFKV